MSSWPSVHVSVFEQGPEVTAVTNDPNPSSAYLRPVQAVVAEAMRKVLAERPADPIEAIGNFLIERADELDREAGSEEAAQKAAEAAKKAREAARKAALAKMPPDERAYAEAVDYVFENADYTGSAKRYANPQENWERFETLLAELQQPYEKLQVVHIAGTNGKGTTSALCDVMLRASASGSVGLFTSPHLHCFRERIRVDGALVSKSAIVEALKVVKPAVAKLPDGYASPFEKLTALALVCFTTAGCKWAVMETGLGGRWDCTNHCAEPLVCGITKIGFDHMNVSARRAPPLTRRLPPRAARRPGSALPRSPVAACQSHLSSCRPLTRSSHGRAAHFRSPSDLPPTSQVLGNTIGAIAKEKAGIIKKGTPAFCVPQHPEALPVLENAARHAGTTMEMCESRTQPEEGLPFWLTPRHQRHNAAMAFAMIWSLYDRRLLPGMLPEETATENDEVIRTPGGGGRAATVWRAARDGLTWPGRFEVFGGVRQPKLFKPHATQLMLDVAHNEPAIEALLVSVLLTWPGSRCAVIFGANGDKDVPKICKHLAAMPTLALLVAVQSSHPKALPTEKILELKPAAEAAAAKMNKERVAASTMTEHAAREGAGLGAPWAAAATMEEALKLASEAVRPPRKEDLVDTKQDFWMAPQASPAEGLVVCCGSVFVVSDMRQALCEMQPDLFDKSDWAMEAKNEPALLM